ncbi:MAG: hypothetical protein ABSE85_11470 [Candidatus Korobacteraceae bacterium]|jgi:hypothetical protein
MAKPLVQTAGRSREVADVKVVALYEPDTGNVVHMHTVVAFKGGRILSEKEAIEEAYKQAGRLSQDLSTLKTKVSSNYAHALRPHRIDPKSGDFISLALHKIGEPRQTR